MGGVIRNSHGSVLIFLTLSLLALTCLQASGSVLTRNITLVNQSRGYSIFILRTFSELASVSLSATISSTLERIKWAMIFREGCSSARFVDFLALQDGTTVLGLLSLAAGAAVPSFMTRVWSTIRLIGMLLVPGIGILIMSTLHSFGSQRSVIAAKYRQARSKFKWRSLPYHPRHHILATTTSQ